MAEERPQPTEIFNMGIARVVRIDSILTLIHEYSIMAMDGDYQKFYSWKNALSRLYMEVGGLLKQEEIEKIKGDGKQADGYSNKINGELQTLNSNLKEIDDGNTEIVVNVTQLVKGLEDFEETIRNSEKIHKLLFPKKDDPSTAVAQSKG